MWVLEEKAEPLPGRVGPARIGVGTGAAAARLSMAGAVNDPLLEHRLPIRIGVERPAVDMPAGHLTALHFFLQLRGRGRPRLRHDLIAVARVYRDVLNTMEGIWALLRSWLRPYQGISQDKLPCYLAVFEFVHNAKRWGKTLLGTRIAALLPNIPKPE
jgi:hypothetical protein